MTRKLAILVMTAVVRTVVVRIIWFGATLTGETMKPERPLQQGDIIQ